MRDIPGEIRDAACGRGVPCLLHFTQIANIPGIVQLGLLPRTVLRETDEVAAYGSAPSRIDGRDGAVSVSVASVNPEMFFAKRWRSGHDAWVVLGLDPSILWTHPCRFCWANAASNPVQRHWGRLDGPYGFHKLFSDSYRPSSFTGASYRGDTGIPDWLPTWPDAEVQVFAPIQPELIFAAWVDREEYVEPVQAEMDRLPKPGGVVLAPFTTETNGYTRWMIPPMGDDAGAPPETSTD